MISPIAGPLAAEGDITYIKNRYPIGRLAMAQVPHHNVLMPQVANEASTLLRSLKPLPQMTEEEFLGDYRPPVKQVIVERVSCVRTEVGGFADRVVKAFKEPSRFLPDIYSRRANCKIVSDEIASAKKLVLSNSFVGELVEAASALPDVMLQRIPSSQLPFEALWIEYDTAHRNAAARKLGHIDRQADPKNDNSGPFGLLIRRARKQDPSYWYAHCFGTVDGRIWPLSSEIHFSTNTVKNEGIRDKTIVLQSAVQQWTGQSVWGYGTREGAIAVHNELNERGMIIPDHILGVGIEKDRENGSAAYKRDKDWWLTQYHAACRAQMGDLRFIVTLLSLINAGIVHLSPVSESFGGEKKALSKYKRMPYSVVKITEHYGSVSLQDRLKKAVSAHARGVRQHDVRGFWRAAEIRKRTSAIETVCRHVPVELDNTSHGLYAMCSECERLIRWVDHFTRGDPKLGVVDQRYRA